MPFCIIIENDRRLGKCYASELASRIMRNSRILVVFCAMIVLASTGCHDTLLTPTTGNPNPSYAHIVYNTPSGIAFDGPYGEVRIVDTSGSNSMPIGRGLLGAVGGNKVAWAQVDTTLGRPTLYNAQIGLRKISSGSGGITVSGQNVPMQADEQLAGAPGISPDGSRLAFMVSKSSTNNVALWVTDNTGNARIAMPGAAVPVAVPAFSPDGKYVAYYETNSAVLYTAYSLFVADLTGSVVREIGPLVCPQSDSTSITWSHDGLYLAYQDGQLLKVVSMDTISSRAVKPIAATIGPGFAPSWSPVSNSLAYTSADRHIVVTDDLGQTTRVLTTGGASVDAWPQSSPDGAWILFISMSRAMNMLLSPVIQIIGSNGDGRKGVGATGAADRAFWLP